MRQKLKIGLTVLYTTVFLVLVTTGALRTQAAEPAPACEQLVDQLLETAR